MTLGLASLAATTVPRRILGYFSTIHTPQHPNIHGDKTSPSPSVSCAEDSALYTLATMSCTFLTSGLNYCSSLYLGMEPSRLRKLPLVQNVAACVLRCLGAVIYQPAAPVLYPYSQLTQHPCQTPAQDLKHLTFTKTSFLPAAGFSVVHVWG